jgi:hypothetical protein
MQYTCANCHREETYKTHGGLTYDYCNTFLKSHELLIKLKDGKQCVECKDSFPWYVLEYDHLNGKKFSIFESRLTRFDEEVLLDEIAKCELVCVNCHRLRTYNRTHS